MSVKVVIALPSEDTVYTDFALCLAQMLVYATHNHSSLRILSVVNEKSCLIQQSRCKMTEMARKQGADAILFIDDDMTFPPDLLWRLAKENKDIIGCEAITHRLPFRSNCENLDGQRNNGKGKGIEEVNKIGTGIMLVRMPVFNKLEKPYFQFGYTEEKGWTGEDFYFCKKAREAGYKIYVDHDLSEEIAHLGVMPFTLKDIRQKEET